MKFLLNYLVLFALFSVISTNNLETCLKFCESLSIHQRIECINSCLQRYQGVSSVEYRRSPTAKDISKGKSLALSLSEGSETDNSDTSSSINSQSSEHGFQPEFNPAYHNEFGQGFNQNFGHGHNQELGQSSNQELDQDHNDTQGHIGAHRHNQQHVRRLNRARNHGQGRSDSNSRSRSHSSHSGSDSDGSSLSNPDPHNVHNNPFRQARG